MKQPTELQNALTRLKFYTSNNTYSIYKTPGAWSHVIDNQFGFLLNAPTSKMLIIAINAYVDGYNQAQHEDGVIDYDNTELNA